MINPAELDLLAHGRHPRPWQVLGAHTAADGPTRFAVWAPHAEAVDVVLDPRSTRSVGDRPIALERHGDGIWAGQAPDVHPGTAYQFAISTSEGLTAHHADPFAFETVPGQPDISVVTASTYTWSDDDWMQMRAGRNGADRPARMSIYEVHVGSWRRGPAGEPLTYRTLAPLLADYAADLGFTHVEFLPVMEHPFGGSWGYQVTGYYAPAARWGRPDDLRFLVDTLHQRGIGVILDWVPAHFPVDDWALAQFDGTGLYEHADPARGKHPDWGTFEFDLSSAGVRNFLQGSALYWCEEYHADGIRVDAVASMLYLDYSRGPGQWTPNALGGNENLEAISFLRELTTAIHNQQPDVAVIAEESSAWPRVTGPVEQGGLGFTHKWNLGWMNDTLRYFERDPAFRRWHHDDLTFGLLYAWNERFILPLSHDEVVHLKGSLLAKMGGDPHPRTAPLRALLAWMWAHPGKQLLFMGGELGETREWSHERALDWELLDQPAHAGLQRLVGELNRIQAAEPALWRGDDDPEGFRWIDHDDATNSVLSFVRRDPARHDDRGLVCIANLVPVRRAGHPIALPPGRWRRVLDTDDPRFRGDALGTPGGADAGAQGVVEVGADGVVPLDLGPHSVIWLTTDPRTEQG